MASSGNYDFSLNSFQIIAGAMRLVSAIQTGETPPADEYDDALKALNGMVTAWQASGIHVWSETDATLFLQPGQITYSIGQGSTDRCAISSAWTQTASTATVAAAGTVVPVISAAAIASGDHIGVWLDSGVIYWTTVSGAPSGLNVTLAAGLPSQATAGAQVVTYTTDMVRPLRVPAARRYIFAPVGSGTQPIETPMSVYSRLDYAALTNKTTPGTPTSFFFDPQLGFALINVWPNPNSNQWAMKFTAQRPLQDFVSQADTADLPQEWTSCIRFNLAREIALEYDVPAERFEMISTMAAEKFNVCSMWDREPQSVYFGVGAFPATRD